MVQLEKVLVCGGVFHFSPSARFGSEGIRVRVTGRHSASAQDRLCTALSPQLFVALKSARRLAISATRCLATRCLSSGVILGSPLCYRTQGYCVSGFY